MTVGPASKVKPSRSKTRARPPGWSSASSTVTSHPMARRRTAAASPPNPAPITTALPIANPPRSGRQLDKCWICVKIMSIYLHIMLDTTMDDSTTAFTGLTSAAPNRWASAPAVGAAQGDAQQARLALRTGWLDRVALATVYLVSAFSLAGFATFGRHPERLAGVPVAASVYGWMLLLAPRVQIIVAFAALALVLSRHVGARWTVSFIALYVLSLASELSGTTVGLPFGPYHYTSALGAKWFGHVPLLIPLSWFFMALPSYAVARRRFPGG